MCSITNLGTNVAPSAVENKIPNVSNLVKKTDFFVSRLAQQTQEATMILLYQ